MPRLIESAKTSLSKEGIERNTAQSRKWLSERLREMVSNNPRPQMFMQEPEKLKIKPKLGRMYMFLYEPLGKKTLPYYDRFPLVFVIRYYPDGFLGLNLHYLQPFFRLKLFNMLMMLVNNDKYDETTKLRITWSILKKMPRSEMSGACVKRYKYSQLVNKFIVVPPDDWEIAAFLPTERFKKRNRVVQRKEVWKDTRNKVL